MSGPPPAYDEHEKYATSQPEYMATFHSVPTPGSPRTTLRPPGHAIYDHSCSTHPPTHIRSQYECHGTPVYQYRNTLISQPPYLTADQLRRRRRFIVGLIILLLLLPILIFFIVMIVTVWGRKS